MTPGLAPHNAFKIILGNAFSPHVFPVLFGGFAIVPQMKSPIGNATLKFLSGYL